MSSVIQALCVLIKHNVLEIDMKSLDIYKQHMDSKLLCKHVGARIKARRRHLEMRQQDLAARMGISRAALANVETGRQNLLVLHLYRFAAALKLHVTDLLPDPAEIRSTAETGDLPLPENLSRAQKAQITRLFRGDAADESQTQDEDHGPHKKTRSRKGSA